MEPLWIFAPSRSDVAYITDTVAITGITDIIMAMVTMEVMG
jgi:hypothetical protein